MIRTYPRTSRPSMASSGVEPDRIFRRGMVKLAVYVPASMQERGDLAAVVLGAVAPASWRSRSPVWPVRTLRRCEHLADEARAAPGADLGNLKSSSRVLHAGTALFLLFVATTPAVYKPRGLTRYGRRNQY